MLERRRSQPASDSPNAILQELPALLALDRLPVPALALASDGAVLFANTAFAAILGRSRESMTSMRYEDIFSVPPRERRFVAGAHLHADTFVELLHIEGWTVPAKMSKSATRRGDDSVTLATFEDLTEQLWMNEA
jgi:PAS domain S-box-containing protein